MAKLQEPFFHLIMVIFPPSSTDLQLLSPDNRAEGFSVRAAIIVQNKVPTDSGSSKALDLLISSSTSKDFQIVK